MSVDVGVAGAPQGVADDDADGPSELGRPPVSRRRLLGGGTAAIAASLALSACGTAPRRQLATLRTPPVPPSEGVLREVVGENSRLVIAGEEVDTGALRRFYARRGYEPVWADRPGKADALVEAVLNADSHGLDPATFHADMLQQLDSFPPLHRDLLISHAGLSYADALAVGRVPVGNRRDSEALAADPIDAAAVLDAAIDSRDPVARLEALAPSTPTYQALREALRPFRQGAMPRSVAAARRKAIEVNLERERWLPRPLPADRVWVNVADQNLVLYREHDPVFATRVVVGEDALRNQSPEFKATIEASFFNPPWVIPADIVTAEILPVLRRDPAYLERNNMFMRDNGEVEQRPGPDAGLGVIMFDMPNRFDVYLHDTPDKHIFRLDNRRISHGCIRVQNPLEFASLLMDQPMEVINERIALGSTTRKSLAPPVPVFVTYQTAFADAGGAIAFRPDFYQRDDAIWRKLHGLPPAPPPPVRAVRRPVPARSRRRT